MYANKLGGHGGRANAPRNKIEKYMLGLTAD